MLIGMSFIICSLFYMFLLCVVYFSKKRISTVETKIYSQLLIINVIGLILELLCCFTVKNMETIPILNIICNRFYLIYFSTFVTLFTLYVYIVCSKVDKVNNKEGIILSRVEKAMVGVAYGILLTCVLLLPLQYYNSDDAVYSYGLATDVLTIACGVFMVVDFICILSNIKNLNKKKLIPLFALLVCFLIAFLIRQINPGVILTTCSFAFVTAIMYFTIENPDLKMVNQLELAKEEADKANRAKTDFLSSMSHEIRTPLNAIVGFSDEIMEANSLEEAKENAKDIVSASGTLLEIVNGILDISKIEAGKLEIINSPYNAQELFLELAKLITPKMNEKGLDFTYNIAPDLPNTLYGDHANLKKIVTNLLSNACKYTDRGFVHYEVSCVNTNDLCKLIISVEDSGRGIKKDSVDKLFTKFQRLDEDRNTTIEGTGLGLAITKQLVELMGGKIIVHTVYGEGSKFTVTISQRIEKVQIEEKREIPDTLDLSGVKILLVDDAPLNLKVASKLLQRYNADSITTCDSGFSCLEKIKAGEKFDVILLDDMMPKMSGVITLKELKNIPGFNTPTIALTANAIQGMREKYLSDGFDDYLAKPIEKDELIKVLNQVIHDRSGSFDEIESLDMDIKNSDSPSLENDKTESLEKDGVKYLEDRGVDINHALELLGDMEMYNMTINDFYQEVEDKWRKIVDYKNSNNMNDYSIEVHSLKSDCKYLGFMSLADIAYKHELASKDNNIEFVNDNFNELEEEYNSVLNIVREYINKSS